MAGLQSSWTGAEIPFRIACPHCGARIACTRRGLAVQSRISCRCNHSFHCDPVTRQVRTAPPPIDSVELD